MGEDTADAGALAPLVGEWAVTAEFPGMEAVVAGRAAFSWLLGRRFVLQTTENDHPDAPDSWAVLAPAPDRPGGYVQHYFDTRGVVRLYEAFFDGRSWTLLRREPDFSPLDFAQRFTATVSDDGDTIDGAWELARDGENWEHDFRLTYRRTG